MQNYQITQIKWLILFIFIGVFIHATALPLFNNEASPIHFAKLVFAQEQAVAENDEHEDVIKTHPLQFILDNKLSDKNKSVLLNSIDRVSQYDEYIEKSLAKHPEVDINEVYAIIMAESQGYPLAYNKSTDARGLGQITPVALEDLNKHFGDFYSADRFDPQTNIEMIVQTLWLLEHQYDISDPVERICAYNEGARGARKYRDEFNDHLYVQKVAFAYRNIQQTLN